ncbi:citrate synthase/methylcitrate synthase [Phreatobacter aquaticus]|uniref:Citrate synthase n=1 Tax=Phreatobacter aquaticus TaxID=2570229 RepID=A0A4D7QLJ5_9HYPH|nr:citrate synthase/methylcitrate synthase [Phreatobacter aquaticus]QCK88478.1 citrate synthase/methylcitrate synthase [Phreatobacter aquaticus]
MSNGLDDVIAAETVLSDVNGLEGRLTIRGHSVAELAGRTRFEDLVALLFDGFFENAPDAAAVAKGLAQARAEIFQRLVAAGLDAEGSIYDAMRAGTARIADGDDLATAYRLLAAPAVLTPALIRVKRGLEPVAPLPGLGHAADIIRMLQGAEKADLAAALDTYLVTVSDHGLNASTFATRVVASTRAGLMSAVLAGLGALKGPLHGGAPGPVIEMLDAIGEVAQARPWLSGAVKRGDRLMGFGHRIYKVRDPRADALKAAVRKLAAKGTGDGRIAFAEAVEQAALDVLRTEKPGRSLDTNVEFYTALLLEALGFPPEAFTCVFAMGRTAGWIAHAREQLASGRLIRPQSVYVGPKPELAA